MKWTKTRDGYACNTSVGSYEVVRRIRRGSQVRFELHVEGERYGGEGSLAEKKEAAQYLDDSRIARIR